MKKDNVILADNLDFQKKHIQIIKDVSMRLAGILNIDQISVLVLEVLVNTLGYKISAVQLIDEEKKNLRFQIINAPKIVLRLVKRFLGFSPSDVKIPLTERKSYLVQSFLEKRITKSNDLYFF